MQLNYEKVSGPGAKKAELKARGPALFDQTTRNDLITLLRTGKVGREMPPEELRHVMRSREKLTDLLRRAVENDDVPRRELNTLFGFEFSHAYTTSLQVLRALGSRRESGHASIIHSLCVALQLLGMGANSYGIKTKKDPVIITPYDILKLKNEEYLRVVFCAMVLHDVVEDSSKSPADIANGFIALEKLITSRFGADFARKVVVCVDRVTNKYSRVLKSAERYLAREKFASPLVALVNKDGEERKEPKNKVEQCKKNLAAFRVALEKTGDELAEDPDTNALARYAQKLIDAIQRRETLATGYDDLDPMRKRSLLADTLTVEKVMESLSYAAYGFFVDDLVTSCIDDFHLFSDLADGALLIKICDAVQNNETINMSDRKRVDRAIAKAEIVEAGIQSFLEFLRSYAIGKEVSRAYLEVWTDLDVNLRCLLIRAPQIRFRGVANLDAASVSAELAAFLRANEQKYRDKYGIHEPVVVTRADPLGPIWKEIAGRKGNNGTSHAVVAIEEILKINEKPPTRLNKGLFAPDKKPTHKLRKASQLIGDALRETGVDVRVFVSGSQANGTYRTKTNLDEIRTYLDTSYGEVQEDKIRRLLRLLQCSVPAEEVIRGCGECAQAGGRKKKTLRDVLSAVLKGGELKGDKMTTLSDLNIVILATPESEEAIGNALAGKADLVHDVSKATGLDTKIQVSTPNHLSTGTLFEIKTNQWYQV